VLAKIGGLLGGFIKILDILIGKLNKQIIKAKFIRSLFFIKKPKDKIPSFHLKGWHDFIQ
jgi:hypothetical protein